MFPAQMTITARPSFTFNARSQPERSEILNNVSNHIHLAKVLVPRETKQCSGLQDVMNVPNARNILYLSTVPSQHRTGAASPKPIPQTAERYTINGDCALGEYGLQLDGKTGQLKAMNGCAKVGPCPRVAGAALAPFEVSCVLTAHQAPGLNATANLIVRGSHFLYEQNIVVMMAGRTTADPSPKPSGTPSLQCIPSSAASWLTMQSGGSLKATLNPTTMKTMSGISGSPELGITGAVVGARCVVNAQVGSLWHKTIVIVTAPQMWKSFSYGADTSASTVSATIGEESTTRKIQRGADLKDILAPTRFSIACASSPRTTVSFDEATGIGQVAGHDAFSLGLVTGDLLLAPSSSMSILFDKDTFVKQTRRKVSLDCMVFGHYNLNPKWNSPYAY